MNMRSFSSRQQGVTLIVTMVMLVVLTLFVLSAIRVANINQRISGNYQWQKQMELLTDSAIERLVSTSSTFDDVDVQAVTGTTKDICTDGTVVATGGCTLANPKIGTMTQPRCTGGRTAAGYSKKLGELTPEDNDWTLQATATDSVSGAKVTIYRGVTVRMLADHCPQ